MNGVRRNLRTAEVFIKFPDILGNTYMLVMHHQCDNIIRAMRVIWAKIALLIDKDAQNPVCHGIFFNNKKRSGENPRHSVDQGLSTSPIHIITRDGIKIKREM